MQDLADLYFNHVEHFFGKDTFNKEMYELNFLSELNSYAIQFKPIINFDGSYMPFSISTLILAGSGSGKDSSLNFLSSIKKQVEKEVNSLYNLRYEKLYNVINEKPKENDGTIHATTYLDKAKKELKDEFDKIPKEITFFSRAGTIEGMNSFFKAYSILGIGSIGLSSSEFGDHYQERDFRKLVELVAEFWNDINPSSLKVTASKGAEKAKNIQSSIRLHSSFEKFKKTPDLLESLQTFMQTSLARRTLFFYLSKQDYSKIRNNKIKYKKKKLDVLKKDLNNPNIGNIYNDDYKTKYLEELTHNVMSVIKHYSDIYKTKSELNPNLEFKNPYFVFKLDKYAYTHLLEYGLNNNEIASKLLENNTVDNIKIADELDSRHFKALRIAALSCFYKLNKTRIIDIEDIKYGIKIAEKSGESYKKISKSNIIVDQVCSFVDKISKKTTVKELEDMEIIPRQMTKQKLNVLWDRCREGLYQQNKIFRSTDNNNLIPQVWVEKLESTIDEIAHISYSTVEDSYDIKMKTISIPIYDILNIPNIKKIGNSGFNNNDRSLDNICKLGNIIIFDVDRGDKLSIQDAMLKLRGLVGFIYPTKNNNKEKNKLICERYRIVLLCKQSFPFGENKKQSEEEYKNIYKSICNHFDIPYDPACCESSRFYWIPEEAKTDVVINKGRLSEPGKGRLLDLRYFMNNLKMSSDVVNYSKQFESSKYWKAVGIKTILEKSLSNAIITGQRNNSLLILSLNLKDYGLNYDSIVDYVYDVNSKFHEPLEEQEIESTILTTLKKRFNYET